MRHRSRHRFGLGIALLAWAMQLLLPVAHAATMSGAAGADASCAHTPALAAKLAALPPDLRRLLDRDPQASGMSHATCAQLCAQAVASPPGDARIEVVDRVPAAEPASQLGPQPFARHAYTPPPRGPPAIS